MQFLSGAFASLFTFTFLLYCLTGAKYRNRILLVATFFFIGLYHVSFLITATVVALFTFYWAQLIDHKRRSIGNKENQSSTKREKVVAILYYLGIGLLVLCWLFFHYAAATKGEINLLMPLGLSFYTFQAIGYFTDIYWQEDKPERNIIDFLLYMLFFMKFLSGPIERYGDLIKQLRTPLPFNYSNATIGLKYILLGLMKKLLIANYLSAHTDIMFNSIPSLSGLQLPMTCLIYPVELSADFSGYTDIAVGGACMFGIKLVPNFDRPFTAKSTSELWRRWHMSLSFWVRDYIYTPLAAATRKAQMWGICFSLLITFMLLGLWHGISMAFALYGAIQGAIICWEMKVKLFYKSLPKIVGSHIANCLFIARTYILFALSLLFFRIASIEEAIYFISNLSLKPKESWKEINIGMSDHICIVTGASFLLLLLFEYFSRKESLIIRVEKLPAWARWSIYYFILFALLAYGRFGGENFVYQQF